jgi:hypothetical protein
VPTFNTECLDEYIDRERERHQPAARAQLETLDATEQRGFREERSSLFLSSEQQPRCAIIQFKL